MTSKSDTVSITLNMNEEELNSALNELVFQEIPHTSQRGPNTEYNKSSETVQTHVFTNFPIVEDSDNDDKAELLEGATSKPQHSFLTFEYYQSFFDIDTKQVLARIIGSMYPDPRINYLHSQIRPKPDYYGPFWISTTLILSIAISGNMANYFASHNSQDFHWQYDFHKVTIATFVIYVYWLLMPSLIYGVLRWRGNQANYSFSELVCLYGYSLFIYIPVSILWLIPLSWLQWSLVLLGMSLSGVVLLVSIWPSVKQDKKRVSLSLLAFILAMHGTLAVGFMLYFFSAVSLPDNNNNNNTTTIATTLATTFNSQLFNTTAKTN